MSLTPHTLAADTLLVDAISDDTEALHRLIALNPVFAVLLDPEHRMPWSARSAWVKRHA